MPEFVLTSSRRKFHKRILSELLYTNDSGIPSNADKSSPSSVKIARALAERLGTHSAGERLGGQQAGNKFEDLTGDFLEWTFPMLGRLRPGTWRVRRVTGRSGTALAEFEQYSHLIDIKSAVELLLKHDPKLASSFSTDYTISPDVVIDRLPEPDEVINDPVPIADNNYATRAILRKAFSQAPILHASVSCKWTLRSDRAQNARTEALNLMRARKGRLPHIVVVTGEPLPTRLASLALGTGDVDCVYHFALYELIESLESLGLTDQAEMLSTMVSGKRLKDISDLPLDLAV